MARGLGVELPLGTAVAAYYRSIFLNVALPGGVVGDVHRGISHGLRAVAWERSAGQVVQVVITVAVLLALPSPVRGPCPHRARGPGRRGRARLGGGGCRGCAAPRPRPARRAAPRAGVAGHRARVGAGRRGPRRHVHDRRAHRGGDRAASQMLPLALLALLAAALPNVGGWGPREGVTAWAFAAAGLGASLGVATAVVYGVMVLVASLPGAAVLLLASALGAPCLSARTRCSAAACRSTATSATRRRASRCPTRPTSTGSTRCAPPATRSWSARSRCAPTTRGCSCAPKPAATSASPAGSRRRR